MEELKLASQTTRKLRDVLLTHHDDQQSIEDNKWWKGMLLLPWANRIDAVRYRLNLAKAIMLHVVYATSSYTYCPFLLLGEIRFFR